jgi:hypothetical protein
MMAHQTGRDVPVTKRCLEILDRVGYARYDFEWQWVWVVEMAAHQFDAPLKAVDYRVKTVKRWYQAIGRNPFLGPFYDRYALDLRLGVEPDPVERRDYAAPAQAAPPAVVASSFPVTTQKPSETEQLFNELVHHYPKSTHLKSALDVWRALPGTPELLEKIVAALRWQRTLSDWIDQGGRFIPRLSEYLRNERWNDRPPMVPTLTNKTAASLRAGEVFVRGAECSTTPSMTARRSARPSPDSRSGPAPTSTTR